MTIREMKDKEKKHIGEYRLLDDRVTELQDQVSSRIPERDNPGLYRQAHTHSLFMTVIVI